jgi:hypothetical protein
VAASLSRWTRLPSALCWLKEAEVEKEQEIADEAAKSYGEYTKRFKNVYRKDEKQLEATPVKPAEIDIDNYIFDQQVTVTEAGADSLQQEGSTQITCERRKEVCYTKKT